MAANGTECSMCWEDNNEPAGFGLLVHQLRDSQGNAMPCEQCAKVCTQCALKTMGEFGHICAWTKQTVEHGPLAVSLAADIAATRALQGDVENEEEESAVDAQSDVSEVSEEAEISELSSWGQEYDNISDISGFSGFSEGDEIEIVRRTFETLEVRQVNWQRDFPCKHHFEVNGVVNGNGGCHDIGCPFSHQQIFCKFGDNCSRRGTCIYRH